MIDGASAAASQFRLICAKGKTPVTVWLSFRTAAGVFFVYARLSRSAMQLAAAVAAVRIQRLFAIRFVQGSDARRHFFPHGTPSRLRLSKANVRWSHGFAKSWQRVAAARTLGSEIA